MRDSAEHDRDEDGVPRTASVSSVLNGGRTKFVVQLLGLVAGACLLTWCATVAFQEKNREQLAKLAEAPRQDVALLVGLSLLSLVVNGSSFWIVIRPVKRVPWVHVQAANALATALANLPFKLSLVCRCAIHHRRDGVGVLTFTTWMGGVLVVMLATLAPILLAGVWRGTTDRVWWAASTGGVLATAAILVGMARLCLRDRVWTKLQRLVGGETGVGRGALGRRAVKIGLVARAREGFTMLSSPVAVGGGAVLRCVDLGVQASRFLVAARIVDQSITFEQAVLAASAYFLVGVLSPTGALGFREAAVFGLLRGEAFSIVVLAVTAAETVVVLCGALVAGVWLRISGRNAATSRIVRST